MFFPEDHHNILESTARTVYLYQNGKSDQKPINFLIYKNKSSFKDIAKAFKLNNARVYNSQGSEIFKEDLDFIKNGSVLYVSKGQEFDPASCFAQYQMLKLLGEGGFGKVFLAEHKQTKEKFAIKIIKTQNIGSVSDIDSIFVQAEVLKSLRHQNIVKVHKCLTMKNMQVVIIMEYLQGGDLFNYVSNLKILNQQTARILIRQVTRGILYCHQRNLTHRDLKLQNLLLVNSQEKKIKIIDFGIAGAISSIKVEQLDTGSLGYMAPECFVAQKDYKFDGKVDIWAIGVILYAMLCGQLPFKGATPWETIQLIKEGYFNLNLLKSKRVSNLCIDFLKKSLQVDPKTRISIQDLNNHVWLSESIFSEQFQKHKENQTLNYVDQVIQKNEQMVTELKDIRNNYTIQPKERVKGKSPMKSRSRKPFMSPAKKSSLLSKSQLHKSKFK